MTSTQTSPYVLADDALDVLFREARTANTFTDEPVSEHDVRAIHDLVKYGPTAMNSQPLRLLVVQSEQARERLLPHMAEGNRAKTASAPLVVVLAKDTAFHEKMPEHFPPFPGARDMFAADDVMRAGEAEFNAALQIGYFVLGVRALGLAAGPMGGFDRAGLDRELLADTTWQSLTVMNIGHPAPDAWQGRLPRISFEDVARVV